MLYWRSIKIELLLEIVFPVTKVLNLKDIRCSEKNIKESDSPIKTTVPCPGSIQFFWLCIKHLTYKTRLPNYSKFWISDTL